MNAIETEIRKLIGSATVVNDGGYARGWDNAVDAVLAVLEKNQHLILDEADEAKMMFEKDEQISLDDRKAFVRNLGKIAAQTRDGVVGMELDDNEIVTVAFKGGGTHKVNINMDSYAAIIRDCGKAVS